MLWPLLAFAVTAVIILWKVSRKKHTSAPASRAGDTSQPITLKVTVATEEPPCSTPEQLPDRSPEKDAGEGWCDTLYTEASRELPAELTITYCDCNGQITHSDITVEKYARIADDGVLSAFCHLRQAHRPFYFSRIQLAADRTNDTVIEDLGAWLDERYEDSTKGACDCFIREHEDALGALFFVATADDALNHKGRSVLRSFCATQGLDNTAFQELVVELVSCWVVPSRISYGSYLRSLIERDEPYRRSVLEHAQAIIGSGKTVHENETRALKRMQRKLKLPAKPAL